VPVERIRNFSIIAHIDHGKSTLADRLLELTGSLAPREMRPQFLDTMDLERERGITIKAQTVRLTYNGKHGCHLLNLIDTPGHVDFTYEVSRSLAACEGALLVVDAAQGVEAQTLANLYLAIEQGLKVLPVLNKIDLPTAAADKVTREIEEMTGIDTRGVIEVSAKQGWGIEELLDRVVEEIPCPKGRPGAPLRALVFDSWFDPFKGATVLLRVFEGRIRKGMTIKMMSSQKTFEVTRIGILCPHPTEVDELAAGEVGFLTAGIRNVQDTRIGDTITGSERPTSTPISGFKKTKPLVFCGLYPTVTSQYEPLKVALAKLRLNDSSFTFEPETSVALGPGFRCGFLGLLHMEIVRERLEREFGLELLSTAPTVAYSVTLTNRTVLGVENPAHMPSAQEIVKIEEPMILATFHAPPDYVGPVVTLCEERRGKQREIQYLGSRRVVILYELPLGEVIVDFYDRLKAVSRGYASMDYDTLGTREAELVKLDILINGEAIDALSFVTPGITAYTKGRDLTQKLSKIIPRQLFPVVIQAAVGSRVVARESIAPLRKQVTAKCYGGDITRKRKLLEKQKEGKKRLKRLGHVDIPQEAFMAVLRMGD
jgi:GTP-binding protein LepA